MSTVAQYDSYFHLFAFTHLVSRAPAYGVPAIRVDGNDVLAVYNATKRAREICINEHRPVILEAMTYR